MRCIFSALKAGGYWLVVGTKVWVLSVRKLKFSVEVMHLGWAEKTGRTFSSSSLFVSSEMIEELALSRWPEKSW